MHSGQAERIADGPRDGVELWIDLSIGVVVPARAAQSWPRLSADDHSSLTSGRSGRDTPTAARRDPVWSAPGRVHGRHRLPTRVTSGHLGGVDVVHLRLS